MINNIFKVFDLASNGKVVPQELLLAFSMSMKGSGKYKLAEYFVLGSIEAISQITCLSSFNLCSSSGGD